MTVDIETQELNVVAGALIDTGRVYNPKTSFDGEEGKKRSPDIPTVRIHSVIR